MKKMSRYLLLAVFAMAAVFVFPVVSEAAEPIVTIKDEASIRTEEGTQGIRFRIKVTNPDDADDFGIKLSFDSSGTTKTKTLSWNEGNKNIYSRGNEDDGTPYLEYTAVIIGLTKSYFKTDFTAKGFVVPKGGSEVWTSNEAKRNIQYVASRAGYILTDEGILTKTAPELLPNGTFDDGNQTGWNGWASRQVVEGGAEGSDYCLKVSSRTNFWDTPFTDSLRGKLELGKFYIVSAWIKSEEQANFNFLVEAEGKNENFHVTSPSYTVSKNMWKKISAIIPANSVELVDNVRLCIRTNNNSPVFYLDQVSFKELTFSDSKEIAVNSDFKAGLDSWTNKDNAKLEIIEEDGKQFVRVYNRTTAQGYDGIRQVVGKKLLPGCSYMLSLTIKSDQAGDVKYCYGNDWNTLMTKSIEANTWTTFESIITIPDNLVPNDDRFIYIETGGGNIGTSDLYISNMSMKQLIFPKEPYVKLTSNPNHATYTLEEAKAGIAFEGILYNEDDVQTGTDSENITITSGAEETGAVINEGVFTADKEGTVTLVLRELVSVTFNIVDGYRVNLKNAYNACQGGDTNYTFTNDSENGTVSIYKKSGKPDNYNNGIGFGVDLTKFDEGMTVDDIVSVYANIIDTTSTDFYAFAPRNGWGNKIGACCDDGWANAATVANSLKRPNDGKLNFTFDFTKPNLPADRTSTIFNFAIGVLHQSGMTLSDVILRVK